jgi:GNAT superfamily N-acetyltransferase
MTGELVPITPRQATPILTQAFAEDPAFAFFTGLPPSAAQTAVRQKVLRFVAQLHAFSGHSIWGWRVDDRIMGTALVEDQPSGWRRALGLLRALPAALGLPLAVLWRLNTYAAQSKRDRPEGISHFLALLGMSDQARGKGLGTGFLSALHAHYGPTAHWALDTQNPANPGFYERFGYRTYASEALGPVSNFKLHRPPQTGQTDENQP